MKKRRASGALWIMLFMLVPAIAVAGDDGLDVLPAAAAGPVDQTAPAATESEENPSGELLIHSGDKLGIEVYREPELSGKFVVDSRGNISYPLLGEIFVDGLSVDELKAFLVDNLGKDYIVNPQIRITIQESPNKSVAILGSVGKPGNYVLGTDTTLVRLISQVGGFTPNASTNNIRILRPDGSGKKMAHVVDVSQIMSGGRPDFVLQPGDFIYVDRQQFERNVPKEPQETEEFVTIMGQVGRAGNYKLAKDTTLLRVLAQAGGFTPVASTGNVRIVRTPKDGGQQRVIFVDAGKIMNGQAKDVPVEPGDLIVVQESFF